MKAITHEKGTATSPEKLKDVYEKANLKVLS